MCLRFSLSAQIFKPTFCWNFSSVISKDAITTSLDADLPESYDKESFQAKISLLLNHFMDMAIQGYGKIANVA